MSRRKASQSPISAISDASWRSQPAEKVVSPAPVMTRTKASSSSRKRCQAWWSSSAISRLIALCCSGRSYVSVTTCPSCS